MWRWRTLDQLSSVKHIVGCVRHRSKSGPVFQNLLLPSQRLALCDWKNCQFVGSAAMIHSLRWENSQLISDRKTNWNLRCFCSETTGVGNVHDIEFELEQENDVSVSKLENEFPFNLTNSERAKIIFDELVVDETVQRREYDILDVITILVDAQFRKKLIVSTFSKYPHLFRKHTADQWRDTIKALNDAGFSNDAVVAIVSGNRSVFNCSSGDLLRMTYALRQVFGTEERMRTMCKKLPILLTLPYAELEEQFGKLKEIFPKNDLFRALDKNPTMFLSDADSIVEKLKYIQSTLQVPEKYIVKSCLFSHSMEHIITRCEFLILSGLYQKPDKHGHSPVENATLRDIVDTSEKDYCRKVAGCTLAEFRAYCAMFDLFDTRSENCIGGKQSGVEGEMEPDEFDFDSDSE